MNQLIAMANELTMTSMEIADLTGKRHDHVLADIRKMLVEIQSPEKLGDYKDGMGRTQPCLFLDKEESYCLMAGYSAKLRIRIIRRWQELEGIASAKDAITSTISDSLALAEVAARMLNLSNSSKLGMLQKVEKQYGIPSILPHYAVDAPADAADGSSRPTKSLTEILKDADLRVSARVAYVVLAEAGIVERKSRPSSGGKPKEFWSLTATGMLYGKNITSPRNPRETQPHFFESRKDAIINMILGEQQ